MRRALLAIVLVAACGKDKPAPAPPAARTLPWLHLTIDVPGDATLEGKEGDDAAQLSWTGVHLTITKGTSAVAHRSLADAIASAGSDAKVTQQGTTADGWQLRYDEVVGGDTLHFVVIHRRIAEAEWECLGGGETPAAEQLVIAACASLRPS